MREGTLKSTTRTGQEPCFASDSLPKRDTCGAGSNEMGARVFFGKVFEMVHGRLGEIVESIFSLSSDLFTA